MEVKVTELRAIADKLLRHIEESARETVEIPYDYYWSIPGETRYDPYNEPADLTIGQLTDDLTELRRIVNNETPALTYDFVRLGALLKAIGETTKE